MGALGWVGRGIWLSVYGALGLGVGFGRAGRAGRLGVGFGFWWAGWAGLGADLAFCVWSTSYMSSSCLHGVFVSIVHVYLRCVSWGLSKTKPGIGE